MTFSIAALCPKTGMLGVASVTSNPSVGSRCTFARAGVGAALTQHETDPRLGPRMLDALEGGADAGEAVRRTVASTSDAAWRQLACVDSAGTTAFHHGERIDSLHAAHRGRDAVAIGNLLANEDVPAAMIDVFETAHGALADRLLAAMEAGEKAGGESEPLASAALLVAWRESFAFIDLRVDLDEAPLVALRRLWHAYAPEARRFVLRAVAPGEVE